MSSRYSGRLLLFQRPRAWPRSSRIQASLTGSVPGSTGLLPASRSGKKSRRGCARISYTDLEEERDRATSPLDIVEARVAGDVAPVMWNMKRRHSFHNWKTAAAEPSVKAAPFFARRVSGRSEAQTLDGHRSGGYRASARRDADSSLDLFFSTRLRRSNLALPRREPRTGYIALNSLIPLVLTHVNM
jgi:hypothetical protein